MTVTRPSVPIVWAKRAPTSSGSEETARTSQYATAIQATCTAAALSEKK